MSLKQLRLEDHYHAKGDNEILINYFYSIHDRRKRDKSMQMWCVDVFQLAKITAKNILHICNHERGPVPINSHVLILFTFIRGTF